MEPTIGRSVREGILAANRSWAAMAAMVGCWILVFVVVGGVLLTTHIPQELLQEPEQTADTTGRPPATAAATPAPATKEAATSAESIPSAESRAAVEDAAPNDTPSEADRNREQERIALEWITRSWPILSLCALMLLIAGAWIQGAQLGYLAKQIDGAHPPLVEFVRAGTRAVGPLLGATLLSLAAVAGALVLLGLVGALFAAISGVVHGAILGLLAVLLVVAVMIGFMWIGVRLTFWFIAVVADARGPLAGLAATFRITRARWWSIFGFTVVLWAMTVGVHIAGLLLTGLFNGLGGLIGGPAAVVLSLVGMGVGIVANLFAGFAALGASIRYYKDLTGLVAGSSPSAVAT